MRPFLATESRITIEVLAGKLIGVQPRTLMARPFEEALTDQEKHITAKSTSMACL